MWAFRETASRGVYNKRGLPLADEAGLDLAQAMTPERE